jgi:hypothetical protein
MTMNYKEASLKLFENAGFTNCHITASGDLSVQFKGQTYTFTPTEKLPVELHEIIPMLVSQRMGELDKMSEDERRLAAPLDGIHAATTQARADEIISQFLLAKGVQKNSRQWVDEMTAIRKQHNVGSLPISQARHDQ